MSWLGDKFSWSNILSGGITGINDDALKAFGMGNNSTLGAVNDALKHGPLETSLEQGRPASIGALTKDRNERLGQDSTGSARTIGDLAALVGMAFGGAAAAGGVAGGGAAAGSTAGTTAGATAGTGASTAAGTGAASSGGWMGTLNSVGQAASAAQKVQGLLSPPQSQVSSSPVAVGNGSAMGQVYSQIQQEEMQRQQQEMQMRQQRRGLLGNGG